MLTEDDDDEYVQNLNLSNDSWLFNNDGNDEEMNTRILKTNVSGLGCNMDSEGSDLYAA